MFLRFALITAFSAAFVAIVAADDQRRVDTECAYENAEVRKEWGDLQATERLDYIDAVLCLQSLPSVWDLPGTKSHFDDFVALHINLTLHIHVNGVFLHWHREFLHIWQTALRTECGYTGYQPYWNWTRCNYVSSRPFPSNVMP